MNFNINVLFRVILDQLLNNLRNGNNVGIICSDCNFNSNCNSSSNSNSSINYEVNDDMISSDTDRGREGGRKGGRGREGGREGGSGSEIADEREVVRAALESGSFLVPCCTFGDTSTYSPPLFLPLPSFCSSIDKIIGLFVAFRGRFCLPIPFRWVRGLVG